MNMKTNGSSVWPYVIVGSAIGGAVGFLFMTESGRKIRHVVTHPDELSDEIEGARDVVQRKARVITDQVHNLIGKAKHSIEEGERAYQEAGEHYRIRARKLERRNDEFTARVHNTVEKVNRTAVTLEQSVLDPIVELGALYRGIERGIRQLFGGSTGPIPIRHQRR